MIDFRWVAANAVWVAGLAWALAAWSWRSGGAGRPSARWGLLLACAGGFAARDFLPERVIVGLVALAIVLQGAAARWPGED